MREVIRKAGPFVMRLHRDRFRALVFSILSQQISGKAADAIKKRLVDHFKPGTITPEALAPMDPQTLRALGLSTQKATYVRDLASRVSSGALKLDNMGRYSDDKVIEQLVVVKGIGVWTAQMFLIFTLGRLDVFPHDDLGVRAAIRNLYGLDELPDKQLSHQIAAPWRPYASIASWYCWRSLEFQGDKPQKGTKST
jgi:DNA-3-methyladenine glycosylase II